MSVGRLQRAVAEESDIDLAEGSEILRVEGHRTRHVRHAPVGLESKLKLAPCVSVVCFKLHNLQTTSSVRALYSAEYSTYVGGRDEVRGVREDLPRDGVSGRLQVCDDLG